MGDGVHAAAVVPLHLGITWHGRAAGPSLLGGFLRCCDLPVKCPSCLTTHQLITAQHYRDLLISDKVSVTTMMLQLSQKAPPVVLFTALLANRQGMSICHPIRLADKVLANIYLLFHDLHQRRS